MKKTKFLSKPRIYPKLTVRKQITDLLSYYSSSGAYNAGRLAEACRIYDKMVEEDALICLTMAGALTPTGLGGYIIQAIKNGLIDFIISTGANLYHDLHFALDLPIHQGDFQVNDTELLDANIIRIYDIFLPENTLLATDKYLQKTIRKFPYTTAVSTATFHHYLGKKIRQSTKKPELSILATAAAYDVPIFTPSPGDSSIGMNLAVNKLQHDGPLIDSDLDILESTAIVFANKKIGSIQLGGGAPKNFYMQTQPMLSQIMNIDTRGHDYFIQITADAPHWGGLSGATPNEAISWKKINPEKIKNNVVVYCDITIAAPILFSNLLLQKIKRKPKRIYPNISHYMDKLTKEMKNARA